jgi:hypothetical protein
MVLAYNLVRTESTAAGGGGGGSEVGSEVGEVRKAVRVWAAEAASRDAIDGGAATDLLLRSVALEHRYTEVSPMHIACAHAEPPPHCIVPAHTHAVCNPHVCRPTSVLEA